MRDGYTVKEIGILEWSDQKFLNEIADYVRYSIVVDDHAEYGLVIQMVKTLLDENNWKILKLKCCMEIGDGYMGVNMVFQKKICTLSIPIEILFHTPETKAAKNEPIIFDKKFITLLEYINKDFKNIFEPDNINPFSHAFILELLKLLKKGNKIIQHKIYRLNQILSIIDLQNNDNTIKMEQLRKDLL